MSKVLIRLNNSDAVITLDVPTEAADKTVACIKSGQPVIFNHGSGRKLVIPVASILMVEIGD